jgi:hypothetical protein
LIKEFKDMATVNVGIENLVSLWNNCWSNENLEETFPQLHSFAKNADISVKMARNISTKSIYNLFNLPLSIITDNQCNILRERLESTNLT